MIKGLYKFVYKRISQVVKTYNIIRRTDKYLVKDKPPRSPVHETTKNLLEEYMNKNPPKGLETVHDIDSKLLERLRDVYVTSTIEEAKLEYEQQIHPPVTSNKFITNTSKRPLPTDRTYKENIEYAYFDQKTPRYGKVNLKNAINILYDHNKDPETNTIKEIALRNQVNEETIKKFLEHYKVLSIIVANEQEQEELIVESERLPINTYSSTMIGDIRKAINIKGRTKQREEYKND